MNYKTIKIVGLIISIALLYSFVGGLTMRWHRSLYGDCKRKTCVEGRQAAAVFWPVAGLFLVAKMVGDYGT